MIAQLGPYLIHTHDRSVVKYMTAEAGTRALESPWDPELGRLVTELDKDHAAFHSECDNMEWLSAPTYDKNITIDASVITNASASTVTNNSHFSFEQLIDDNSIETMNRNSPGKRKQSNRIIQPPLQQQNDDISIISEAQTIATMDTRISVMESSINNMSKLMTMFMS